MSHPPTASKLKGSAKPPSTKDLKRAVSIANPPSSSGEATKASSASSMKAALQKIGSTSSVGPKKSNKGIGSTATLVSSAKFSRSNPALPSPSTGSRKNAKEQAAAAAAAARSQVSMTRQHQQYLILQAQWEAEQAAIREKENLESKRPLTEQEKELIDACRTGNVDSVYRLILNQVDVNCRIPLYGTTPLSLAYRHNHKNVCSLLTAFGAKLNPDNYGATPIHWAAHNGHTSLIKDQLKRGYISTADLQKRDQFGSTPLHFASVNNLQEAVKGLLECGSESLIANNDGRLASDVTSSSRLQRLLQGKIAQTRSGKKLSLPNASWSSRRRKRLPHGGAGSLREVRAPNELGKRKKKVLWQGPKVPRCVRLQARGETRTY
ncbi:ankyrin repeat-containing domain protein [Chytriomyces sp. MP71]|nr:ankyrin repeat-containing domain protein [Chytriomyces sp. MP71]